jgi:hypothetical protein
LFADGNTSQTEKVRIFSKQYDPNFFKGLISGAIIAGYGFGSFTFNMIALSLVNPNNEKASVVEDGDSYFTDDVAKRVPSMFRILAIIYISIGTIGCLLVKMPKSKRILKIFKFIKTS